MIQIPGFSISKDLLNLNPWTIIDTRVFTEYEYMSQNDGWIDRSLTKCTCISYQSLDN